jgi:hypothetical protein
MLKTNEKKMKSLGQRKIKSMKRGCDFSTIMDVFRDEGDWEFINFQLLVLLFSVYLSKGVGGEYFMI